MPSRVLAALAMDEDPFETYFKLTYGQLGEWFHTDAVSSPVPCFPVQGDIRPKMYRGVKDLATCEALMNFLIGT
jgi:hypothetical protein